MLANKAKDVLGCVTEKVLMQVKELILSLNSALVRSHLECWSTRDM